MEVEGRGFHTSLYTVKGAYSGGREGASRVQWLRMTPNRGEEEALPIRGEEGRSYEANAEDAGCRLMVRYTPVREDGAEGQPETATSPVVEIGEPSLAVGSPPAPLGFGCSGWGWEGWGGWGNRGGNCAGGEADCGGGSGKIRGKGGGRKMCP